MAFDIYTEITDRIIAELEKGIIPWEQPWTGTRDGAISYSTGTPYSLLNQMLLGKPGEYLTFKQIQTAGGRIKKGGKARMVVFWKWIQKEKTSKDGTPVRDSNGLPVCETIPFLRYYNVFHIDDCEGIEPKWTKEQLNDEIKPDDKAQKVLDDYLAAQGIPLVNEKGNRAFYRPSTDEIHLPLLEQFKDIAEYYSTAFHEATHSTGHPKRLNRISLEIGVAPFGSEDYSKEELVAEIGAASVLHELGMETSKTFRNTAAYIQSWIRALKNDKRMIVSAAGKADKAVDMILNRQPAKAQ